MADYCLLDHRLQALIQYVITSQMKVRTENTPHYKHDVLL